MSSESETTLKRRVFIAQKLRTDGQVSVTDIQDFLKKQGKYSESGSMNSWDRDMEYVAAITGIEISKEKGTKGKPTVWVNISVQFDSTFEARLKVDYVEKLAIARTIGSVALASPRPSTPSEHVMPSGTSPGLESGLAKISDVRQQLKKVPEVLSKVDN